MTHSAASLVGGMALLWVGAGALRADPAAAPVVDSPIRNARLLLNGRVRAGTWTAVEATVEAPTGSALAGTVSVEAGAARYRKGVTLPARTVKNVVVPVFIPPKAPVPRVEFVGAGPVSYPLEPALSEVAPDALLIGVDPAVASKNGLELPQTEVVQDIPVTWVSASWADVKESPEILDGLDGLALGEVDEQRSRELRAVQADLGAWLGRGGRLFMDGEAARKAVAAGWRPSTRSGEAAEPAISDLFPRAGGSPRRAQRGRMAFGTALALGAAAVALLAWRGLPRRGPAVVLAAYVGGATAAAMVMLPARGVSARGAAAREVVPPSGASPVPGEMTPAPGRAWEAIEGFVAVASLAPQDVRLAFPPRTRVTPAAATATDASPDPMEVSPDESGWSVRVRFRSRGVTMLRFSRFAPAVGTLRVQLRQPAGEPVQVSYDSGLDVDLSEAAVVAGGIAYPVGTIAANTVGARDVAPGEADGWPAYLRRRWPAGDPRRTLREWWGRRRARERSWTVGATTESPFTLTADAELDARWGPVLVAVTLEP